MRRNIGLLIDDLNIPYTQKVVKGAELAALSINANLYLFPGMHLANFDFSDDYLQYSYQYNTLFQFANTKKLDVLYVLLDPIGNWINQRERKRFLEQYLGIPVVTLFTSIPDYNAVLFDNETAFGKQIRHLIVDHNAKKIGYISGPKGNVDATERLQTFQRILEEQHIPFDSSDIIYGSFAENSESLIESFITAHPDYDALVFANDIMAQVGYHVLKKLGLTVGSDVLVVGFDNASFSSMLNPPLTTVEASPAELAYVAVKHAEEFINQSEGSPEKIVRVNTHNIHRCSCGCSNYDYDSLADKLYLYDILDDSRYDSVISHVTNYMFGGYTKDSLAPIKKNLSDFIHMLCSKTLLTDSDIDCIEIRSALIDLIDNSLFFYTTAELFVNFLASLEFVLERKTIEIRTRSTLANVFSMLYQELAKSNIRTSRKQFDIVNTTMHIMDEMSADMSHSTSSEQIPYSVIVKKLHTLGIRSAYLFTYEKPIFHPSSSRFIRPEYMLFRTYAIGDKICTIPEDSQRIQTSDILGCCKITSNDGGAFIVSPLFSQEELLGLIICETDSEHFSQIPSLAIHISSMLKTLLILEQQREINDHLQTNLDQMFKHNQILKEISKTDQLTGLYNRRGFMDSIYSINNNPLNDGKHAILLYADMDGLKTINDKYGHDEGDFALKEISVILKEAFRSTDIVSRFGGDEFVAFALLGIPNQADIIRQRIEEITEHHNQIANKPYRIEMSLGICEIKCSKDLSVETILEQADQKLYREKNIKKERR